MEIFLPQSGGRMKYLRQRIIFTVGDYGLEIIHKIHQTTFGKLY